MRVPTYDGPAIAPQAVPQPVQSIQTSADAFGAALGSAEAQGAGTLGAAEERGSDLVQRANTRLAAAAVEQGGALANLGKAAGGLGEVVAKHAILFQAHHDEAAVKDAIANQYGPKLRTLLYDPDQGFMAKQGKLALDAYHPTLAAIQQLQGDIAKGLANDAQREVFQRWADTRINADLDGVARHATAQSLAWRNQTSAAVVKNSLDDAANAAFDPGSFDLALRSGVAELISHGQDTGQAPETIRFQTRNFISEAWKQRIERAAVTDPLAADRLYRENQTQIDGAQHLELERALRAGVVRRTGENNAASLLAGRGLAPGGDAGARVAAQVVAEARAQGVDARMALTIARIESDLGQDPRMDAKANKGVFQLNDENWRALGGTAADRQDPGRQVDLGIRYLAQMTEAARAALGREPEPWEVYLTHQQGTGGGPALLKAAAETPAQPATAVIGRWYQDGGVAAITGNGGRADMTAAEFVSLWRDKYQRHAGRVPDPQTLKPPAPPGAGPGEPGSPPPTAPTATPTPAGEDDAGRPLTLPGSPVAALAAAQTPQDQAKALDRAWPGLIAQIQRIPDLEERHATMAKLEYEGNLIHSAAAAATRTTNDQAWKLALVPGASRASIPDPLWAQLSAETQKGLLNHFDREAKDDQIRMTPSRLQEYERLHGQLFDPAARDQALKTDYYKWSDPAQVGADQALPMAVVQQLIQTRDAIEKGDQAALARGVNLEKALALLDRSGELGAAGIRTAARAKTEAHKEMLQQFTGQLEQGLQTELAAKGKALTEEDMLAVGRRLLTKGRTAAWIGTYEMPLWQMKVEGKTDWKIGYDQIPEKLVPILKKSLTREFGRQPTQAEISQFYTSELLRSTR